MNEFPIPWLELSILIPLVGAIWTRFPSEASTVRQWSLIFSGLSLICTLVAWFQLDIVETMQSQQTPHNSISLLQSLVGWNVFMLDELSAPLPSMVALLHFLTTLSTLSTKIKRFSFSVSLFSLAISIATFGCKEPRWVIALLAIATVPPFFEIRNRGYSTRVYSLHMILFVALMIWGWRGVESEPGMRVHSLAAILPLLLAVFIRSGVAPFHCWMTDLFDKATFGTALLFVTPFAGAYAAIRLVLPVAPDWVLRSLGVASLFTAVYSAGLAMVQRDARRFFCFLFLSHSALVLAGLESVTPMALTGALCVWISVAIALGGFGLTLRAIEARRGRLSLDTYQGLYEHTPALAICFLMTGLASAGFPGTFGFVGTEILVDGVVGIYPIFGVAVVIAGTMNGIAMVQAYFRLFTGTRYASSISLNIGLRERIAVMTLAALILLGGLIPQPGVHSRHHAAVAVLRERHSNPVPVEQLPQNPAEQHHKTVTKLENQPSKSAELNTTSHSGAHPSQLENEF